jgi:hypothetical protein
MESNGTKNAITREDFISDLLLENNISLPELFRYNREHQAEIKGFKAVFDLKTEEDIRRYAALIRIICPEQADDIFANRGIGLDMEDVLRYKLPVLTALAYNPSFFTVAMNVSYLMRAEIIKKRAQKNGRTPSPGAGLFNRFAQPGVFNDIAASPPGTDPAMLPIGRDYDSKELQATFSAYGNNRGNFKMMCRFNEAPAYKLDVMIKTNAGSKEHLIHLDQISVNDPDQSYSLEVQGVDFSKGFELTGWHKPED